MKLTHIDAVKKNKDVAFHNQALDRIEQAVAAAVASGHEFIDCRTLNINMTPAVAKELKEAGLTWTKFNDRITWGSHAEPEDKPKK